MDKEQIVAHAKLVAAALKEKDLGIEEIMADFLEHMGYLGWAFDIDPAEFVPQMIIAAMDASNDAEPPKAIDIVVENLAGKSIH